jgi:hypothetical protein
LDRGPTELTRNFGMAWGIGGWLLTAFLQKTAPEAAQKLRERVSTRARIIAVTGQAQPGVVDAGQRRGRDNADQLVSVSARPFPPRAVGHGHG